MVNIFLYIAHRREGALQDVAVPPITRFPITLEEQTPEERYARFKNLRVITLKKVYIHKQREQRLYKRPPRPFC